MSEADGEVQDIPADEQVEEREALVMSSSAMGAIVRSEVMAQLEAAHRFPRSLQKFLLTAKTLATSSQEMAESCFYALERTEWDPKTRQEVKKLITGPSVRMAEIAASSWGNMHCGARVVAEEEKFITAQGMAWDLESNTKIQMETRRRITNKKGRRYSDDMVVVTGNAAASIALRNSILRVVPRAHILKVLDEARKVAVGTAATLVQKRTMVLDRLEKRGVSIDRVLTRLGMRGPDDIGLEQLEILIALGTTLKTGEASVDDLFPPPVAPPPPGPPAEEGKRISLKKTEPAKDPSRDPGQEG